MCCFNRKRKWTFSVCQPLEGIPKERMSLHWYHSAGFSYSKTFNSHTSVLVLFSTLVREGIFLGMSNARVIDWFLFFYMMCWHPLFSARVCGKSGWVNVVVVSIFCLPQAHTVFRMALLDWNRLDSSTHGLWVIQKDLHSQGWIIPHKGIIILYSFQHVWNRAATNVRTFEYYSFEIFTNELFLRTNVRWRPLVCFWRTAERSFGRGL